MANLFLRPGISVLYTFMAIIYAFGKKIKKALKSFIDVLKKQSIIIWLDCDKYPKLTIYKARRL